MGESKKQWLNRQIIAQKKQMNEHSMSHPVSTPPGLSDNSSKKAKAAKRSNDKSGIEIENQEQQGIFKTINDHHTFPFSF